jgi:hypothetical protein
MRGGTSSPHKWGWEEYAWEVDEEGRPTGITCPQGCQGLVFLAQTKGRFIIRFEEKYCAECPYYKGKCRIKEKACVGLTLYVNKRIVEVARQRKDLHPEDTPIRVVVESTIRSVKRAFPGSKLPVRGLIRSRMMLYLAPLMVNVRRLHKYLSEKERREAQKGTLSLSFFEMDPFRSFKHAFHHLLKILSAFRLQPVYISLR